MAVSSKSLAYIDLLRKLLPKGRAWDRVKEDDIGLLEAVATEYCRVDERGADLLNELDPRTATEMLSDWETLLALPDECTPAAVGLIERRDQARQKLSALGGISKSYYENIAQNLGFDAIISDYQSFRAGRGRCGDPLATPFDADRDVFKAGRNRAGDILVRHGWRYTMEVNVEATTVTNFRAGIGRAGDPLALAGNDLLQCTMAKLKPAHTSTFFTFRN